MQNTKIGNLEAICLIFTIIISHALMSIPNSIILEIKSASILNVIYIGIFATILSYIIYKLMNNFPTFDIIDISFFLGGNILKKIIGLLFEIYFIIFSSILLRNIIVVSQVLYLSNTSLFFICLIFILGAFFSCTLKYNSIYRSNMLLFPIIAITMLFIFFANWNNYNFSNVFPILGNGEKETFLFGIQNLYIFQGIGYLYFLPPILKEPYNTKKIFIYSIIISEAFLILSIGASLLIFGSSSSFDELIPLLSVARYIEFGHFFQRLDPIFLLIGIIVFESFICIVVNICSNIFTKITNISNKKAVICFISILLFSGLLTKNYSISTYIITTIYKYAFFIFVIGINLIILILANIKKKRCLRENL